jgi:hypothetical protein
MLATLNAKQIVDEIVKDTVKDNDPHDAVQISPEIVRASRPVGAAPTLAPEIAPRPEPKIGAEIRPEPKIGGEFVPVISAAPGTDATAPSVDIAVRTAASDLHGSRKPSSAGKWLRGALVTVLFAGGSAAATVAWEKHGDTARQMLAQWTPLVASLLPSTSQTAPVSTAQAAPPAPTDQTASEPAAQVAAAAPAAAQPDPAQSLQSMTQDLAAMAQQIEALKANIAELKAGQEQMAREMAKPSKPVAETKPIDPRPRVSALPPRPAAPPVRKPKPAVSQTYMPAYSPAPLAPPPPQAAAVPSPPPAATTQAVADDDGPVVRPPMPLR